MPPQVARRASGRPSYRASAIAGATFGPSVGHVPLVTPSLTGLLAVDGRASIFTGGIVLICGWVGLAGCEVVVAEPGEQFVPGGVSQLATGEAGVGGDLVDAPGWRGEGLVVVI
jgi:hypothetical protein